VRTKINSYITASGKEGNIPIRVGLGSFFNFSSLSNVLAKYYANSKLVFRVSLLEIFESFSDPFSII